MSQESQEKRSKEGIAIGLVGLVVNIILVVIKVIAGLLANSVSILADAMNNLGDSFGAIFTIAGFHIAQLPPDHEHPYGHQRAEYISGLFTSIIILVVGFQFLLTSIEKIINPTSVNASQLVLVFLIVSILFKVCLGIYYQRQNKKLETESSAILALAKDSFLDSVMSLVIVVSYMVEVQLNFYIDGYIGALVAIFIIYGGITSIIETSNDLLGTRPDPKLIDQMQDVLDSYDALVGYHDLILHKYGPNKVFATVDIEIDSTWDIVAAHNVMDAIEREFAEKFDIKLVSHLDPVEFNNPEHNRIHGIVKKILKSYSSEFHFHDFRVNTIESLREIYFEVVVPDEVKESDAELYAKIESDLKKHEEIEDVVLNIHFDRDYFLKK